jgi:predicted transcriptional regulator
MSKELTPKQKFHSEFQKFKDNHIDFELKNIFEIFLPFWFCRQNVVVEKEIELDRFSKIIFQTIQSGFTKHSEICKFLGVEPDAFVTMQFHFLIKNGLLIETLIGNDTQYEITFEGLAFLERKKKITAVETVEFEYFYNDLTKDFVDTSKPLDTKNISEEKSKKFSGYQVLQTNLLPPNRFEILHKNKPYNLNKVEFANFFNKQQADKSFYDFESNNIETHKRSICFLAFEYEDKTGVKKYDIRHFKKTVNEFDRHEIEETLTRRATEYFSKNPIPNEKKNIR